MEDQVPFKVYMFWRRGVEWAPPEIRRFGVDKNVVTNFKYLQAKVQEIYPKLKETTNFSISWKDEDGDAVRMSTDEEVMIMLAGLREAVVKLFVYAMRPAETTEGPNHVYNLASVNVATATGIRPAHIVMHPAAHLGVTCDGCNRGVVGFRYKCITCKDFDLCAHCEARGVHPQHNTVRIPSPGLSPAAIDETVNKSRDFLKNIAAVVMAQQRQQEGSPEKKTVITGGCPKGCPMPPPHFIFKEVKHVVAKERREERREQRQEKRQERQEERQQRLEERREKRAERPPRRGWMHVFSKYMEQFANLAVDHITAAENSDPDNSQTAEQRAKEFITKKLGVNPAEFDKMMAAYMNGSGTDEGTTTSEKDNATPNTSAKSEAPASEPATKAQPEETTPATAQAPTTSHAPATSQSPVISQIPAASQVPTTSQIPTTSQAAMVPAAPAAKPEVNEPGADSKNTESTSNVEIGNASRDGSPDKSAEGWTMINNDKDSESDLVTLANLIPTLPEEFRSRPWSQGQPQPLYPPLNAATAVCDPKDPVKPEVSAPGPAPTPATSANFANFQTAFGNMHLRANAPQFFSASSTSEVKAPSAPNTEIRHHHHAHIDAAVHQMIAMGFTNEGGWLTQLLESKDGNIAAVLDLLTPVNPNRK